MYNLLEVFHTNFVYNMHRFRDIGQNRSERSKSDLSDVEKLPLD